MAVVLEAPGLLVICISYQLISSRPSIRIDHGRTRWDDYHKHRVYFQVVDPILEEDTSNLENGILRLVYCWRRLVHLNHSDLARPWR